MQDRYMMLKIETVVNKILYKKNIIDKREYEQAEKKINNLLLKEENG